jgi:hypothetical protein
MSQVMCHLRSPSRLHCLQQAPLTGPHCRHLLLHLEQHRLPSVAAELQHCLLAWVAVLLLTAEVVPLEGPGRGSASGSQ